MGQQSKVLALKNAVFKASPKTEIEKYNHVQTEIVSQNVYQSWQRSFDNGIYIDDQIDDRPLQADLLSDVLEQNRAVISLSTPEVNKLYQLIKGAGNVVLLANKNGVIINQMGDAQFVERASRILLTKGAKWGENDKGTNAIGTAIKEDRAVTIHGGEHYLNAHAFLTCSSVPIHDPYGGILGVLDITGDYRGGNPHTLALINMSVEHIENEMFNHHFHQDIIVELYSEKLRSNLDAILFQKTLMVFNFEGKLIAANKCAMNQFNLTPRSLNYETFEGMFSQNITRLIDHIMLSTGNALKLNHKLGKVYFAKAKTSYARLRSFSNTETKVLQKRPILKTNGSSIDFTQIDLGDTQTSRNIARIKKIMSHDIPILLQGETGTGKGWLAQAIHSESQRAKAPFIAVNCASLPRDLIESELFGYVGGAFTGANNKGYDGKLAAANNGYLFLDEIGDMPLDLQTRLLRALEDKQICPIGSNQNIDLDIRVISASNANLRQAVDKGTFRQDLYYRLNGLTVNLPKLNARDDFYELVNAILANEFPNIDIGLSQDVWRIFEGHTWPGNIRQLHHILKVAALVCEDNIVEISDLPDDFLSETASPQSHSNGLRISGDLLEGPTDNNIPSLEDSEKIVIIQMLEICNNNLSKTAKKLGISRNTLYSKIKQYSINQTS